MRSIAWSSASTLWPGRSRRPPIPSIRPHWFPAPIPSAARPPLRTSRLATARATAAVRIAEVGDARAVARLLHDFNREFDEPTPAVEQLADRMSQLLGEGDTVVLLVGDGPDGLAVLRFRPALWSSGLECYLAELYVAPGRRGRGLGRALMEAALR